MRRIELQTLALRNFRGTRDLSISFNGGGASIHGRNATGKTTIADAYAWLLFEKDSRGRKDFELKTLDASGRPLSGVDHEVEATLVVDGEELVLKRVYREKWTKKRGAAQAELTGHETQHFIDGVPVTKTEYAGRVKEILDEFTWRLLSDPLAFQSLPWRDRREVVLQVSGNITDEDVISSDATLAALPGILGKRTLDEHRKVVTSRRSQLNKELAELPARIDEVQRGLPEAPDQTAEQLQGTLETARADQVAATERLAAAKAGAGDTATERRELASIESQLTALELAATRKHNEGISAAQAKLREAEQALAAHGMDVEQAHRRVTAARQEIERLDAKLAALRAEWAEVAAREVHAHVDGVCPTCQQELPEEQVSTAHAKAVSDLNARKARELEQIQANGKALNGSRAAEAEKLVEAEAAATALVEVGQKLTAAVAARTQELEAAQAEPAPDAAKTPEYAALAAKRDEITLRIASLEAGDDTVLDDLQEQVLATRQAVTELDHQLSVWAQRERGETRTVELRAQERTLNAEFEKLEQELFLLDEFVRARVALLESKVASRFNLVRFRLFRHLVNGGIEECCDATVEGVPFEAVNHAGQIAAGLDIIRTLQAHHQVSTPVFIDQAESIHDIPETGAQQIALVVSPKDKKLRVELRAVEGAPA